MSPGVPAIFKNNWFCFFVLALAVFIVFGNAFFNGFVYDDHYLIKDNPYIKDFVYLGKVLSSDVAVATSIEKPSGYYRPASMVFLMAAYKIFGLNTAGLHLLSLLLHIINVFFIFLLIKRISGSVFLGFLTAVIFAVHPIHVEAVTPIFNFMGLLATFFSLASFWAFVKSQQDKKKRFFVLSVLLFFFAVSSKEEAVTLPAVFVLYDLYFVSNLNWKAWAGHLLKYGWFLIPAAVYLALRFLYMPRETTLGFWSLHLSFNVPQARFFTDQILSAAKIFADYLWLLIFPFRLSAYYLLKDPQQLNLVEKIVSAAAVLGLAAAGFYFADRRRLLSFFIFFFFITAFIFSNMIPVGGLFAERFMYFPSLFFCVVLGMVFKGLFDLFSKDQKALRRLIPVVLLIVTLGLYAKTCAERNYVWRNDIILWKDTCQKTTQGSQPFRYLGDAYAYHGPAYYHQALAAYEEALKKPDAPQMTLRNSIGTIYGLMNQQDLALAQFKGALALGQSFPVNYYNVGITYYYKGDYEKALAYFNAGQALDKNYFWLYYGRGLVYEKEGRPVQAREMFEAALKIRPDFKVAQDALARLKNNG